jgi:hypothetical protein
MNNEQLTINNYQLSMTSHDARVYLHPTTYSLVSLVPRLNLGTRETRLRLLHAYKLEL